MSVVTPAALWVYVTKQLAVLRLSGASVHWLASVNEHDRPVCGRVARRAEGPGRAGGRVR